MEVVVNSYGSRVRCEDGMFRITSGDDLQLLSPFKVTRLLLASSCSLSTDAIALVMEHGIELVLIKRNGHAYGRIWDFSYGSTAELRRAQAMFPYFPEAGIWIKGILLSKVKAQISLLKHFVHRRPAHSVLIIESTSQLEMMAQRLADSDPKKFVREADQVRGFEGYSSKVYFNALTALVPAGWYLGVRSRRPAKDKFNCALNYLYGILYGRLEGIVINHGLDPAMGFLHRLEHNRPSLVLDLIEPYRPWADQQAVKLCQGNLLSDDHFDFEEEGVLLNEAGRKLVIPLFNEYMNEVVQYQGMRRSRYNQMHVGCTKLTQVLKELNLDSLFFQ